MRSFHDKRTECSRSIFKQFSRFILLSLGRKAPNNVGAKSQAGSTENPNHPRDAEIVHHWHVTDSICRPDGGIHHPASGSPAPRPDNAGTATLKGDAPDASDLPIAWFPCRGQWVSWARLGLSRAPRTSHCYPCLCIIPSATTTSGSHGETGCPPPVTNTTGRPEGSRYVGPGRMNELLLNYKGREMRSLKHFCICILLSFNSS